MHVVIACGAMNFGPATPAVASLGGSETAALMLGKELSARGHTVDMFCNLPAPGAPDFVASGTKAADGVTYRELKSEYGDYVAKTQHDLTIIVRDPGIATLFCKSTKKVLWAHDIFTMRGMKRAIEQMGFVFDEIWSVSEWHRQQIHEATGYPLSHIKALRNGIVRYDDIATPKRDRNQLIYAARPERGLDNLIRPGGVMDNLPEYHLTVCMYEHFPDHMKGYYESIKKRMAEMPNVTFVGGKPNKELRRMIGSSVAYIYPTQFEETSCILARECAEQLTPFYTTKTGALVETLQSSGLFFEDWLEANGKTEKEKGSQDWCADFAQFFRETHEPPFNKPPYECNAVSFMRERRDLYWDGVAELVEKYAPGPNPAQTCGAAIIAYNNEDTILKCLNSLVGNVDAIQIALGPCTDNTLSIILDFAAKHQDIALNVKDVPKIEAYKFGFDQARNASVDGLNTDWILWIDTDEYLVGNIRKYLRPNYLQSYLIPQHHFTVEPKGAPTQIDRPARLFRRDQGFTFKGHIHEHAEVPEGGPGRAYMLPDVDIGHTGYQNEEARKGRFHRNYPFLEWEHKEPEQRKLNHFLWLRDIIHRMRFAAMENDQKGTIALAQEAKKYYNEHYEDMGAFGPGIFHSLGYITEVNRVLGKGTPVGISVQLDEGRSVQFQSLFDDYNSVERILKQLLEPEFKDRSSKYYG